MNRAAHASHVEELTLKVGVVAVTTFGFTDVVIELPDQDPKVVRPKQFKRGMGVGVVLRKASNKYKCVLMDENARYGSFRQRHLCCRLFWLIIWLDRNDVILGVVGTAIDVHYDDVLGAWKALTFVTLDTLSHHTELSDIQVSLRPVIICDLIICWTSVSQRQIEELKTRSLANDEVEQIVAMVMSDVKQKRAGQGKDWREKLIRQKDRVMKMKKQLVSRPLTFSCCLWAQTESAPNPFLIVVTVHYRIRWTRGTRSWQLKL